jgi:hypothetical protein
MQLYEHRETCVATGQAKEKKHAEGSKCLAATPGTPDGSAFAICFLLPQATNSVDCPQLWASTIISIWKLQIELAFSIWQWLSVLQPSTVYSFEKDVKTVSIDLNHKRARLLSKE